MEKRLLFTPMSHQFNFQDTGPDFKDTPWCRDEVHMRSLWESYYPIFTKREQPSTVLPKSSAVHLYNNGNKFYWLF